MGFGKRKGKIGEGGKRGENEGGVWRGVRERERGGKGIEGGGGKGKWGKG